MRQLVPAALCVMAVVVLASRAGAGPVTILSQNRSISASASVEINTLTDAQNHGVTAPPIIDLFNASTPAEAHVDDPISGQSISASSSASVSSELTDSRISFVGQLTGRADLSGLNNVQSFHINDASASVSGLVGFRLAQSTHLAPTLSFTGNSGLDRTNSTLSFGISRGGSLIADLRSAAPLDLDAGDYELGFTFDVGRSNTADFAVRDVGYTAAVDFSAPTAPIPLPPASFAALMTLPLLGALLPFRRRLVGYALA